MALHILVLGSNAAVPAHGRHPSAQMLFSGSGINLIDCGEGTLLRMQAFRAPWMRIQRIFISHLHGDHVLGLPGLLTAWHLNGRETPVTLYGPSQLEAFIDGVFSFTGCVPRYPLRFVKVPARGGALCAEADLRVSAFALNHRGETWGYRFTSTAKPQPAPRRCAPRRIVTIQGNNAEQPASYAYCSDTAMELSILPALQGVGCLYHEATFAESERANAMRTKHSTAFEAGQMAHRAQAGYLLLGHFSARYRDPEVLVEEAARSFHAVSAACEGTMYTVTNQPV